jgi:hypothetical protein
MMKAEHPLLTVLNSEPINRQARVVTSQRHVAAGDLPLTREELVTITNRLQRKQRLLKLVLGIKTKAQHANTIYKFNRKIPQFRRTKEPRALVEYVRVGQAIARINRELAELRAVRRFVAAQLSAQSTPQPADVRADQPTPPGNRHPSESPL